MGRGQRNPVELLHLLLYVRFGDVYLDHRCLDILVPHRILDGERVGARHGHLRTEGVQKPVDVNARDADTFADAGQSLYPYFLFQHAFINHHFDGRL